MKKVHLYYVYIMANERNGTTYIGMTSGLFTRGFQHKESFNKNSFTDKYNVKRLVYYEMHDYVNDAIEREKKLKKWNRDWKIKLIEKDNPCWRDLFLDMLY